MPRACYYDRHPEVPERSEGSKGDGPPCATSHGLLILRGSLTLAPQDDGWRCLPGGRLAFLRSLLFSSSHHFPFLPSPSPLVSARRSARGSSRCFLPTPNEGGGGAPQGAHWVFDHAGEARCRVNGTRRSRCDRDAPLGAPPWRFPAAGPRFNSGSVHRIPTLRLARRPDRKIWPTGSRTSRSAVRIRLATGRHASLRLRFVSGDAPHERDESGVA